MVRTDSFRPVGAGRGQGATRRPDGGSGTTRRKARLAASSRVNRSQSPSGPFTFLLLIAALLVAVAFMRPDANLELERNFRIKECVTNLELLAERQAEFHAKNGRYLACSRFPTQMPEEEPFTWRYNCKPGLQKVLNDGSVRYLDCRVGEVCDPAYRVCLSPDDDDIRPAYVETAPDCWEQLMGFLGDLPLRGQYEVQVPPSIHPTNPAHDNLSCHCAWDATCTTDLNGDGVPEIFRATDKKTTWTTAEIDYDQLK